MGLGRHLDEAVQVFSSTEGVMVRFRLQRIDAAQKAARRAARAGASVWRSPPAAGQVRSRRASLDAQIFAFAPRASPSRTADSGMTGHRLSHLGRETTWPWFGAPAESLMTFWKASRSAKGECHVGRPASTRFFNDDDGIADRWRAYRRRRWRWTHPWMSWSSFKVARSALQPRPRRWPRLPVACFRRAEAPSSARAQSMSLHAVAVSASVPGRQPLLPPARVGQGAHEQHAAREARVMVSRRRRG